MQRTARRLTAITAVALLAAASSLAVSPPAAAYTPISGAGSTWSANAINAWKANVSQYGMEVNYAPVGSTIGRNEFKNGTVAFAGSDIPYGVRDGNNFDPPPDPSSQRAFAYMPDTAGGTVFMYNLKIGLRRVTNLRLSGDTIAKIFTGVIKNWNDPAIAADNPGLTLPATPVVPVVRSDGSGSTAQFTQWMVAREGSFWNAYCGKVGRSPCTQTSAYPVPSGSAMVGQPGDLGVAGYVAQAQAVGAIGYVEYSYAIQAGFPVAKMLNSAGYYTEPTPGHVAVALLKAKINNDKSNPNVYLTQDLSQVYTNPDRRTYPLSSYSYMILPTDTHYGLGLSTGKGTTLAAFGQYALCQGQNQVDALGYSALPINLVQAGFDQLKKIPGSDKVPNINIKGCPNPTFSPDGSNLLAKNDPYPLACDKKGPSQCVAGTGGAKGQGTPVNPSAQAGNPTGGSNGVGGSGGNGGSGGSGPNNSGSGGNGSSGPGGTGPGGSTGAVSGPGGVVNGPAGSSSAAAAAAQQATCDPDTGCVPATGASANGASDPLPNPTSASASLGDGLRVTLMALAAALLLGLGLGPPLIAHISDRRRQRQAGGAP